MYSDSCVSGRMQGSNKYLVSAYGINKEYSYAHIFIETETSGIPVHVPELLVSVHQVAKYDKKKPKKIHKFSS